MGRGFFITGTDTGVGKTVIAGAMIRAVRMCDLSVCGMKPVESGCGRIGDSLVPLDGSFLKDACEVEEPITMITPCCLETPLSPMMAAEIEGLDIDIDGIMIKYDKLSRKYDAIVVEGAGGLLVPIKRDYFVADLAKAMGLPLIVVSSPLLGTLNHTLLTVDYALRVGLDVAGVVINNVRPPEGSLAEKTNFFALQRVLSIPLIGEMPYLKDIGNDSLEQAVARRFSMPVIRESLGL